MIASCVNPEIHLEEGPKLYEDKEIDYIPYNTSPDWESTDVSSISTGLAVSDIDGDNIPDIIVANGNDIERQKIAVYYNDGLGGFSSTPDWTSYDIDYHGHLSAGDIDQNGYTDIAVSVYLGSDGFSQPGYVKVYYNYDGELESTPSWISNDTFYTFSLKLGDIDNDGDLDLAVATGESYYSNPENDRIYLNTNGNLNPNPDWLSDEAGYSMDVDFADIDNDRDLDLVFVGGGEPANVYLNDNGVIQTTSYWESTDSSNESNSLMTADIDNNGYVDIVITDNYQQGGAGKTKIYLNDDASISPIPDWTSSEQSYGSGVFLYDMTRNGYPEIVMGNWGEGYIGNGKLRIYKNDDGIVQDTSEWVSSTESVVEAITFVDVDRDGILTIIEKINIDGNKSLLYLSKRPVEKTHHIKLNDNVLTINDYTYDKEAGWVTINEDLMINGNNHIEIHYDYSRDADMIVSNWDSDVGNFLFYNTIDASE